MSKDRRINEQIIAYWNSLRKGRAVPAYEDIKTEEIIPIWEDSFVARIKFNKETGRRSHRYIAMGEHIEKINRDVPGALLIPQIDALTRKYQIVTDNISPVIDQAEHISPDNKKIVKYRQAIVPFGDKDDTVTHLLVSMRCKVFDAA